MPRMPQRAFVLVKLDRTFIFAFAKNLSNGSVSGLNVALNSLNIRAENVMH